MKLAKLLSLVDTDKLKLEQHEHTLLVRLNNPPAHTWDQENLAALQRLMHALNKVDSIYAVVITGEGEKFFSAGADLKLFADGNTGRAQEMASLFGRAFETLAAYRGVTIAAINGYAMGGGLECALACDIRIAEEHAQLALPEASVGLLPCAGGTQRLPWLVGEGWAKRMILCGERLTAEQALKIGLVEQVVKRGEVVSLALKLAGQVAQQSPCSVKACKELISAAQHQPFHTVLPMEREAFLELFETADQKEGVNAFLEKRPAVWQNK
ncbi:enoyl-CoA hydratase [Zooshikella marina]|uniref:Enoyl-CoA hydratase n=1 Tax=Zooshikella ganghwensis TaxID=202772 RepID=A0A4V1INV8_9GAMM|nr:enoyl-CoA hydratase [Zooshikella ganghwensis]MBU2705719.1 enoyl-CoA hydratase [Zooshikella ganghwensis]RDH45081.1 enoyl-CoA hydratase [Zooshikella ganghwensis]